MERRSLLVGGGLFAASFLITASLPKKKEPIAMAAPVIIPQEPQPVAAAVTPVEHESVTVGESTHYKYNDVAAENLVHIADSANGKEFMAKEAAPYFHSLVAAAAKHEIRLSVVSAFRSYDKQKGLWENQIKKRGSEAAAAVWSAPPGYSEHHTGFAVDFNGEDSSTILSESFENTTAYRWLSENAARFNFYLSFPKDNAQKIGFEPWHWKYKPQQQHETSGTNFNFGN
jgi:D-alanyl-D-alanine carboxypeptidase